jgi:transcriptional regulator with XRE-family HTH domain
MGGNVSFGARMKEKRLQMGLTQLQAAEMSNVSLRHWQELEKESRPLLHTAAQIAAALQLDLNEFRDQFPEPEVPPKK